MMFKKAILMGSALVLAVVVSGGIAHANTDALGCGDGIRSEANSWLITFNHQNATPKDQLVKALRLASGIGFKLEFFEAEAFGDQRALEGSFSLDPSESRGGPAANETVEQYRDRVLKQLKATPGVLVDCNGIVHAI
jgi:hypothetical protein